MTTPVFKLTKGTRSIDLQSGRYRVRPGWAPPPISEIPMLADGTSANRAGATLIGTRPVNRSTTLPVNVLGSSTAEIQRGLADLQMMLSLAGDESEPLYLEFKPNSDTPEPFWGNYGVNLRYEIVNGAANVEDSYLSGARLATDVNVVLSLNLKPYAVGKAQRLASGIGGVQEDILGVADGIPRALMVPEVSGTGGNQFANPVFGNGTWNAGWTAGANVNAAQNTDLQYILFGTSSVKLTCFTTPTATYVQSINLGSTATHVVSCYTRKRDGSAITSADAKVYYAGDLSTTYQSIGNGWYRLWASFTGIASAQNVGISLQTAGVELFADMFQVERLAYPTAPYYGDLLGCAWSGTAHNSASTRVAARLRLPVADAWNQGGATIRMIVRLDVPNTHPNNMVLWSRTGAATVFAQFNATGDTFQVADGTNTATSAAQTIAAGDIVVLHFTLGTGGLIIYKAGASIATASYARSSITVGTDYIYLGSGSGAASQIVGAILGVEIWDRELTAAQVAADYANITPLVSAGQRVSAIPWLWTKDGDDIVDNCDDSTHNNWAVIGGVPGSIDARTELFVTRSAGQTLYLGQTILEYGDWLKPITRGTYQDSDGTVDANSSSGQRLETAGASTLQDIRAITQTANPLIGQLHTIMRAGASSSSYNLQLIAGYSGSSSDFFGSTPVRSINSATLSGYYFGGVMLPVYRTRNISPSLWAGYSGSVGGGVTSYIDICLLIIGRLAKVDMSLSSSAYLQGSAAFGASGLSVAHPVDMFGDVIELTPNRSNMLTSVILEGADGSGWTITRTLTFDKVLATPRWALL